MSTLNSSSVPTSWKLINGSTAAQLFTTITFPNKRPNTPFPPLVQAYFENGNLQVSALVLIDEAAGNMASSIVVYIDTTQNEPTFYITYKATERQAMNFLMYQVNFNIAFPKQPSTIQTYVYDEDPTGSRGTTTTVQP